MRIQKKQKWRAPLLSAAAILLFAGITFLFASLVVQEEHYTAMDVSLNLASEESITEGGTSLVYSLSRADTASYEMTQIESLMEDTLDLASFEEIDEASAEGHRFLLFHAVDEEDRYFLGGAIGHGDAIIGMEVSQVTEDNMHSWNGEDIFTLWIEDRHYQHARMTAAWSPTFTVDDFHIEDPIEIDQFEQEANWMMGYQSFSSTEDQVGEYPYDSEDVPYLEADVCSDDQCGTVPYPRNPHAGFSEGF
ncbi:hypothetical protein [Alkalicoccus chagannorensis]|uniref:hypothetical protein n=1 Tax=Alkalicoccus chagannorensis TaxID=427072 RepID=UPI0012EC3D99|nr:hypothetical protein [Alkalicoccus chagannorensis]